MKRRKVLAAIGALSGGSALLTSTGAFTSVEADRDVAVRVDGDADSYLRLAACTDDTGTEQPNGEYVVTDDGQMGIDLTSNNQTTGGGEGVNADARSTFDNVLELCNQGTQEVCVDFELNVPPIPGPVPDRYDFVAGDPAVVFYRGSNRDEFVTTSELNVDRPGAINLGTGECQCIGFEVRSFGFSPGEKIFDAVDLTIRAEAGADCEDGPADPTPGYSRIFLTNSGDPSRSETRLLSVEKLDDNSGEAILQHVKWLGDGNFDQVDSMALTPDLETLYFYDKDTDRLGKNDLPVANNPFVDIAEVGGANPDDVVLGEFIPGGNSGPRLLAVSQNDNNVYEISDYDGSSPSATLIGDTGIQVTGSDIEWVEDGGNLYLHTNGNTADNKDLYTVDTTDGSTTDISDVGTGLTGTALGESGSVVGPRELIGSVSGYPGGIDPGEIIRFDIDSGDIVQTYEMTLDGDDYEYHFGDMTSGITDFGN
jgi:hypothetical protein